MVSISGGKAGSVKRIQRDAERSSGDRTWVRYLKEGEDLTVRFLTEPDEWYSYREHYDPDRGFFPCIGKDSNCPGCEHVSEKVQRSSRRYLANALDVESGFVVPIKLPLDLANRLVARYERNSNTLMNRDYTLHRMGKGLDTTYDVTPEDKSKVDTSQYKPLDLEKVLVQQFEETFDLNEDDDEPVAYDTDSDLDEDDEVPSEPSASTDEDDDEGYLTEAQALAMSKPELKALAEQVGVELDGRWSVEKMVEAIFAAAE
jgi:hypothetical protein